MEKDIVKVSWSGGKDSTCAMILHLWEGHEIKAVNYIPMFTNEIPLLTKSHYEFIQKAIDYFRKKGVKVHTVSGITYCDFVRRRSTRGKYKGRIFGFPCFISGLCHFQKISKTQSIQCEEVGFYDYEDIGIAADEKKRLHQLNETKRSILYEKGITEEMAKKICQKENLLSPLYEIAKRDGCTLCPNANIKLREKWFQDYPEAIPILWELQEFVKKERPGQYPLRKNQWFLRGEK